MENTENEVEFAVKGIPVRVSEQYNNDGTPKPSKLRAQFYYGQEYNLFKTNEARELELKRAELAGEKPKPMADVYDKVEMVRVTIPDDPNFKDGHEMLVEGFHRQMFFREYKMFREGKTDLDSISIEDPRIKFLNAHDRTELMVRGIMTVQQLAAQTDTFCPTFADGYNKRESARHMLTQQKKSVSTDEMVKVLSAEVSERDKQIAMILESQAKRDAEFEELKGLLAQSIKASRPEKEKSSRNKKGEKNEGTQV